MAAGVTPATPPMGLKALLSMDLPTTKAMQIVLLKMILPLPEVDPVLANLIKWYLWASQTRNTSPLGKEGQASPPAQSPKVEPVSPTLDTKLPLACEPVASATATPSDIGHEVPLKIKLPELLTFPDVTAAAAEYPTPPISNPPTRPLSVASPPGSDKKVLLPAAGSTTTEGSEVLPAIVDDADDRSVPVLEDPTGKRYPVLAGLGNGSGGRVVFSRTVDDDKVFAIKIVHKPKKYRRRFARWNIVKEKECLERVTMCGKPFISQLLSSWDDEENVYFVMRMYYEDMYHRIYHRDAISPHDLKIYTAELIAALANVHASGVVHRDIKPTNILIAPSGHLALADFGLAFVNMTDAPLEDCRMTDIVGTGGYWAPEVITSTRDSDGYDYLADVWSMGMVIFQMYHGRSYSFYRETSLQLSVKEMMLREVPLHKMEDDGLRKLLERMIVKNPDYRSSAKELKEDEYFADIDWQLLAEGHYQPEYLPNFPSLREHKSSIRFSSFHCGDNVTDGKSVYLSPEGRVIPNSNVVRQLQDDKDSPSLFRFRYGLEALHKALHEDR